MKYYLFTTYYISEDQERNDENFKCLKENYNLDIISRIFLFLQNQEKPEISDSKSKIEYVSINKRPKFSDFFNFTNQLNNEDTRFIIANSDIFFDETLSLLNELAIENKVITLTRWDLQNDNSLKFYNKFLSQDVWIFSDKINPKIGDYFIGQHGCDNRLLYELDQAGKKIINPSLSVKTIHVHMSQLRPYFNDSNYKYVQPPYKYSLPHGLTPSYKEIFNQILRSNNQWNYNLRDYYYIRFEYNLFRLYNTLQKVNVSLIGRIISVPKVVFYYCLFQLFRLKN